MKFGKKLVALGLSVSVLALSFAGVASAHVTVKPGEALTGTFQTFTVSVPVEKDIATTSIKLDIPSGLSFVTPTMKSGWSINVDKQDAGEAATVKSITWSGGQIDPSYRDDFTFSAKTPNKSTELHWKAYQTYADGTVVSWDQPPTTDENDESGNSGPVSITKVAAEGTNTHTQDTQNTAQWALYLGIAGTLLGLTAVFLATRRKA